MGFKGEHLSVSTLPRETGVNSFGPGSADVVPQRIKVTSPNTIAESPPARTHIVRAPIGSKDDSLVRAVTVSASSGGRDSEAVNGDSGGDIPSDVPDSVSGGPPDMPPPDDNGGILGEPDDDGDDAFEKIKSADGSSRSIHAQITSEREAELGATLLRVREKAKAQAREELGDNLPNNDPRFAARWKELAREKDDFCAARNELAQGYTGLANSVVLFYGNGYSEEDRRDFAQVSELALLEAAERYDPTVSSDFSHLAYKSVKGQVVSSINTGRFLHIPVAVGSEYKKITEFYDLLVQKLGRIPSPDEVTEAANKTLKLRRPINSHIVRGFIEGEFDDRTKSSVVPNGGLSEQEGSKQGSEDANVTGTRWWTPNVGEDKIVSPVDVAEVAVNNAYLGELMDRAGLNPRERYVIFERHNREKTAEVVAVEMAQIVGRETPYSHQNVTSIARGALKKMREASMLPPDAPGLQSTRPADIKQQKLTELRIILGEPSAPLSIVEMAERLGVSTRTVSTYLQEINSGGSATSNENEAHPVPNTPSKPERSTTVTVEGSHESRTPVPKVEEPAPSSPLLSGEERDDIVGNFEGTRRKIVELICEGGSLPDIAHAIWPDQEQHISEHLLRQSIKKVRTNLRRMGSHMGVVEKVQPDGTTKISLGRITL